LEQFYTPSLWTPELLDHNQMAVICHWLMTYQKAWVSAVSVMDEGVDWDALPENLAEAYQSQEKELAKARSYVQDLLRHINAMSANAKTSDNSIHVQ
jgi:hypothetical protein